MCKILFISIFLAISLKLFAGDVYTPDPTADEFRKRALEAFFSGEIIQFFTEESIRNSNIKVISLRPPENKDVCHIHSSKSILGFDATKTFEGLCGERMTNVIANDFVEVSSPQNGDLVAYYNPRLGERSLTHTGIYRGDGLVESKWGGVKAIFLHPIFYSLTVWGDQVKYYRIK